MTRLRERLPVAVLLWVACQFAALTVAPAVLCHTGGHESHHAPAGAPSAHTGHGGHTARVANGAGHGSHNSQSDGGPRMSCRCKVSDAGFAAMTIGSAPLPDAFELPAWRAPVLRVVVADRPLRQAAVPDFPPPRA